MLCFDNNQCTGCNTSMGSLAPRWTSTYDLPPLLFSWSCARYLGWLTNNEGRITWSINVTAHNEYLFGQLSIYHFDEENNARMLH